MEAQQKYDIKDLRHIADEIEPGLNLYSQLLKKIANRLENEYAFKAATSQPEVNEKCVNCDEPAGFCEEDAIWNDDGEPLCEDCYYKINAHLDV